MSCSSPRAAADQDPVTGPAQEEFPMSSTDGAPDRNQPDGRSDGPTEAGRRRARILIPVTVVVVILAIFAFILIVSQIGGDDGEVYRDDSGSGPVPAVTVLDPPG
jgi:hypothetical protein